MKRIDSIDFFRAISIIGMILCHFVIYTSLPDEGNYIWLHFIADQIIGNYPAAFFLFISGVSLSFSLNKQIKSGKISSVIRNRTIKKGVWLFIAGLIFQVFIWSSSDIFDWDVLTTIASSLLIIYALRKLPNSAFYLISVFLLIISPILFQTFDGASMWLGPDDFEAPMTIRGVLIGYFIAGYFPVCPWVAFALIGFTIGRIFLVKQSAEKKRSLLGITGVFFIFIGLSLSLIRSEFQISSLPVLMYVTPLHFYPLSLSLFCLNIGLALTIFWFFHVSLDISERRIKHFSFFQTLSRYSLTIYILHHAILTLPQKIAGVIKEGDQFAFLLSQEVISPPIAFLIAVISIPFWYLLGKLWDKKEGKFSFEWALNKISG